MSRTVLIFVVSIISMCVLFTLIKTNEIYQLMSLYRKNESINIVNMTCDEYILICANQMLENQCLKIE